MHRGVAYDSPSNAKPLLLLAIIEGIEEGRIIGNKIEFNENIDKDYQKLCEAFEPTKKAAPLFKPFYHSAREGYYNLKWKDVNLPAHKWHTPTPKFLREHLDYASLDEGFWEILQDQNSRTIFKELIINNYLNSTTNLKNMKYSDIITLRSMRSAYNIREEGHDEWKTFIANDQFNDILNRMVKAVRNNDADYHKSVWIAGTYGTGKSHAGAVLKHLFCDPVEDIRDYVEEEYKKEKYALLRNAIIGVREQKRLFPVNLYGQQSIAHEEDLSLQLQKEIKNALDKAGIEVVVQTDFDTLVQHIDEQPAIWQSLIDNNSILSSVAPDLKKLKQLLTAGDTEVLDRVRNAQRRAGIDIRLQGNNIQQWIFEVQEKLHDKGYNGLLIIWDEFTEIMTSSIGTRLLVRLQEISEAMMSPENDSYFLFISHPSALNSLKEEEREKTKGRYHYVTYNMEPVSAFKIMSKKFMVVNDALYQQRKNRFFVMHCELFGKFSSSSAKTEETIENIQNLYPLHPSTANLATYYAREAGSSSRSVFEFLASEAVRDFLDNEDNYANDRTITCDYLWDYVREYFESDTTKFGAVTERYNSHHLAVEAAGDNYLRVFKGILLLNALNNIANNDTVTPSTENIENLFVGTEMQQELIDILDFLNDKSIIQRQPNGNYSILFTALPGEEIQRIKEDLTSSNFLYTDQVIKFGDAARDSFDKSFKQVNRSLSYQFFSKQGNEYTLLSRIENTQREAKPYELFLAIMVARNQSEMFEMKDIADRNSREDRFRNTVFMVMEVWFGDKNYERFIEYQANAQCAQRHGLPNQQKTYSKNASDMITEWTTRMKGGNVSCYLRGDCETISGSKMASTLNFAIAPAIFDAGPESLDLICMKSSNTYWKKASVKATVDAVLSYHTKQDLLASSACTGPARHVEFLLQDSVDDNLDWKTDVDPNHPLKKVCDYVDEWLSGKHTNKNQTFNLGEKLEGLTKPPYGLFQGYAPMAMVAFAMRKYVNQIFDTNGKQRTAHHLVDDVVEMFKAWEMGKTSQKLNFMFESKEAGKLCKNLIAMFSLKKLKGYSDISSLKDARWAIQHEYAKEKGYPLWALKYCDSEYNTSQMRDFIDNVMKVVGDPESMKNPQLLSNTINEYDTLKYEWGNLLIENEGRNYQIGFDNFLKSVEIVSLQDTEIPDAMRYLYGHLEGEVGLWKESEVKDKLKDWRMTLTKPVTPYVRPVEPPKPQTVAVESPVTDGSIKKKRDELVDKMKSKPSEEIRGIVNEIIEKESGEILDILLKYVQ